MNKPGKEVMKTGKTQGVTTTEPRLRPVGSYPEFIFQPYLHLKKYSSFLALFLLFACGGSGSGPADSDSGGGSRHLRGQLGRQVSGSRLISEHYKYDKPCAYISESSVASMLGLEEGTTITWTESENTCEISVNNKKVISLSTTSQRPFESVFHAEYYFDRLYKPEDLTERGKRMPYTGPEPEGTGAEGPTEGVGKKSSPENTPVAGAPTDSAQIHANPAIIPNSQLNDNAEMKTTPQSIPGVGEKVVWDARKRTLHVLNLQHVFHVMVNHSPTAAADSLQAMQLAALLIRQVDDEANQGEHTIY